MKTKIFGLLLLTIHFASVLSETTSENVTVIDGPTSNFTTKHIIGNKPIVIQTQIQHYDQPTLKEYEECHQNLEKCKKVCEGVKDPVSCVKECPVCPFLVKEKVVIQGINDTHINSVPKTPLNTTNIIRLTNQIQNIIDNHNGNINYKNENIIHVHQNISRVGGKFGLGYNNTDPCCIVVRAATNCLKKRFSTANRCHHKRHRECGQQCKSRVMEAKRVTICEEKESPVGDYEEEICNESVQYIPYHSRKNHSFRSRSGCMSIPTWPYVSCGYQVPNYQHSTCTRCQHLPYYHILQSGIPTQCIPCLMPYYLPMSHMYPAMTTYPVNEDFNDEGYFDLNFGGWHHEKSKCKLPDGTIIENCYEIEGSGTESPYNNNDYWKNLPEQEDESDNYDDYGDNHESLRRRRHTFTPSKYSRRIKK